jgi:hypothetical protein
MPAGYQVKVHVAADCKLDLTSGDHCPPGEGDPNDICPGTGQQVTWQGDFSVSPPVAVLGVHFKAQTPCLGGNADFLAGQACTVSPSASSNPYYYTIITYSGRVCTIDPKMIIQRRNVFTLDTFLHFPGVLLPILILVAGTILLMRKLRFRNAP